MRFLAALLAASLPLLANGEAQLLPYGKFKARDGRPGPGQSWTLDNAGGQALASDLNALVAKTPLVIDYEHQTLRSETNGQPAPASGWITSVTWRDGQGLFASVDWTDRAKALIAAKEYRFISPVILTDMAGHVTGLYNAALVGTPALLGMEAVVAQLGAKFPHPTESQEPDMALLAALLTAIGLPADTTEAKALEHVTALKARPSVPTALVTALGLTGAVDEAAAAGAVTALKAKPAVPIALSTALGLQAGADEAAAIAAVTTLKVGADGTTQLVAALQSQVNSLTTESFDRSLNETIDKAIADKKIAPAARKQYTEIGRSNFAQLTALISALPAIPGLGGQSGDKERGEGSPAQATALSSQVMAQFGLTAEQFAKAAAQAA